METYQDEQKKLIKIIRDTGKKLDEAISMIKARNPDKAIPQDFLTFF